MPAHDPFFKRLFQHFLGDLLHLVAPELAAKLDPDHTTFLRDEFFSARGDRRQADLLAAVPWLVGERLPLLAHVEVQARARRATGERMCHYSMHIALTHERPPLSVLVNLKGGRGGVRRETWRYLEGGYRLMTFDYWVFDLGPSPAQDYLRRPEPLAWALAALMRSAEWSRARLKLGCLRRIAAAELDRVSRGLLVDCVSTYLELVGSDEKEYRSMLAEEQNEDVAEFEMTWSERLRAEERKKVLAEFEETWSERLQAEGRQKGFQEGMKQLLLRLVEQRFGALPAAARRRLEALTSTDELTRLGERLLTARSLEELDLA